jgi:hypothetical protein
MKPTYTLTQDVPDISDQAELYAWLKARFDAAVGDHMAQLAIARVAWDAWCEAGWEHVRPSDPSLPSTESET